ncbi:MAG: hypothetical protein ACXAEL_08475 [Candidatus Hodarchaeales archaeon]|jgi:hypothetical protein
MENQQPFPRERLENELQLAGQKLDNLIEKRSATERTVRDIMGEIQSLEQSLAEKRKRLTQTQQSLQATRAKIDQVDKIRRLLKAELEKTEDDRQAEFQKKLEAERKRREEGKYSELEARIFQEILKEVRTKSRRPFSEKEESSFLRSEIPISIHDRAEKLTEYEKVTSSSLSAVVDELAFQHNLLQNLPSHEDLDTETLRKLNQAGMTYLMSLKMLGRREGPVWEFQNFIENPDSAIAKMATTYHHMQGFAEILDLEVVSYSSDSHITAVCKLIVDDTKNKINSALEPLRISIQERLDSILKQLDSDKRLFLNDLFKEAVLKNKIFSAGSLEGIADLGKISLDFSERDIFGRDTVFTIDEIQNKLNVISLVIAEIFLEDENVRKAIESRLS